jgi:hypothetical protein
MVNGYRHILEYLYNKYYECFSQHSDVTSSHWRTIGRQRILKKNNKYLIDGYGFGSYKPRNLINHLGSLPEIVLQSHLLRKYHCPKYLVHAGKTIAAKSGNIFSFDSVKQILSLNTILKTLDNGDNLTGQGIRSVCVIGDGYSFFSSLIKLVDPDIKVISVNLGRTLFFDVLFSERCLPEINPILLKTEESKNIQLSNFQLVFIEAEKFSILENLEVDLFINIASMQEMNPAVIVKYFKYMRSSQKSPCYFYCCNRLIKELPDGTLTEFMKYPWKTSDDVLLDELCPWYQKYPSSRPPFWRPFDGPMQHRFIRIK